MVKMATAGDRAARVSALVPAVIADAEGDATDAERARLAADPVGWAAAARQELNDVEAQLARSASLPGQVVADLQRFRDQVAASHHRALDACGVILPPEPEPAPELAGRTAPAAPHKPAPVEEVAVGEPALHATWDAGKVVVWVSGPGNTPFDAEEVTRVVKEAGAKAAWAPHSPVAMPVGDPAPALAAPVGDVLGWLVAVHGGHSGHDVGPSVRWLGAVAAWGTELVAQGRMAPWIRKAGGRKGGQPAGFEVRWKALLVEHSRLKTMAQKMPGAIAACQQHQPNQQPTWREDLCSAILDAIVHGICSTAARMVEAPAGPPVVRTPSDAGEAILANLAGGRFDTDPAIGGELGARIQRWWKPAETDGVSLVVQLSEPDRQGAWPLAVLARGIFHQELAVEQALVVAPEPKRKAVESALVRLERLLPASGRPGGLRRGEAILDTNEAWELMSGLGQVLTAAGFAVRVPAFSSARVSPTLRLSAEPQRGPSSVGVRQLCEVAWSVRFGDTDLTEDDLARLATQAKPLIRSGGGWVELRHADIENARKALAERGRNKKMDGLAILRHGLGLERGGLGGPVLVDGGGWAADLLTRAGAAPEPADAPEGFGGTLRDYQAQALGWLAFLDRAELGGCLALDMGLGKTPTMLAHLLATKESGPALVIAPPAVLGNWAAEARKFTPGLRVRIHHGASRAEPEMVATAVSRADVLLTTYGTAVRDVDALKAIDWARVVLDEAQAIKNSASDTAQALASIGARSRIALTGTPVENGLGDLWAILEYTNPGLVGPKAAFVEALSERNAAAGGAAATKAGGAEAALRALNGLLVFRRTKAEPIIAAELPDKIDQLDHCAMTPEQIGLYQALLDQLTKEPLPDDPGPRKGRVLAAITALKQICDHPAAYTHDDLPLIGRSGKLARLYEILEAVYAAEERVLIFTHFAEWGVRLAEHLTEHYGKRVACYHGGLSRTERDRIVADFQSGKGAGCLVLSLTAGGTGLNLTAANHVVLYDRWWNPAKEDQARDRAWRIGQTKGVISHRLVCPGTIDERVEEVVEGKRRIADIVLPKSSSLADLGPHQLRAALGLEMEALVVDDDPTPGAEDAA